MLTAAVTGLTANAATNNDHFGWLPAGVMAATKATLSVQREFAPSGSTWAKGLDERKVFHAALSTPGGAWTLGIGKGGQIYSLRGPFGEAVPPQEHKNSEWNDEVWQLVAVCSAKQAQAKQTGWQYFIHGSGTYRRDPKQAATFYGPIIAEQTGSNSYAVITWSQNPHVPTPYKSGVFFTTRWRALDAATIEITYGIQNWGDDTLDFFNVPWGGVSAKTFPVRELAMPDGTRRVLTGMFPSPNEGIPLDHSDGWQLYATGNDGASSALGLVVGRATGHVTRNGIAGHPTNAGPRDYFVTEVVVKETLLPGDSFWARRFMVIGGRDEVIARARSLAALAETKKVAGPLGLPVFAMRRAPGEPEEITSDPYRYASQEPVTNRPGMAIWRPYAAPETTWRLLGFETK